MAGSFETNENHASQDLRPIRVPTRKEDIFGAAREMVEDLAGWEVIATDDKALSITCRRKGGLLGGTSKLK